MAELMCPGCTRVHEFESVPAAMACTDCGTVILPRDPNYMARVQEQSETEIEDMRRSGLENPLSLPARTRLYTRIAQVLIDKAAERGDPPPFGGHTAAQVAADIIAGPNART